MVDMVYVNNILLLTAAKNSPDIVDVSKVDFTSLGKTTVTQAITTKLYFPCSS